MENDSNSILSLIEEYRSSLSDRSTHQNYKSVLVTVARFYEEEERDQFQIEDMVTFREWLRQQDYSKPTQRSYLVVFRKFLTWANNQDHLDGSLFRKMQAHYELYGKGGYSGFVRRQIEHDDIEALLTAFSRPKPVSPEETNRQKVRRLSYMRDRAIVNLLAGTGLRISELIALNSEPFYKFFGNWDGKRFMPLPVVGKGEKPRTVIALPECLPAVKEYLDQREDSPAMTSYLHFKGLEEPLFISHSHKHSDDYRLTRQSAWRSITATAKALGLESFVSPHALRHYYLDKLAQAGVDLRSLSQLAGHADVRLTDQAYLEPVKTEKLIKEIARALNK